MRDVIFCQLYAIEEGKFIKRKCSLCLAMTRVRLPQVLLSTPSVEILIFDLLSGNSKSRLSFIVRRKAIVAMSADRTDTYTVISPPNDLSALE
jgi:hypothetical protein